MGTAMMFLSPPVGLDVCYHRDPVSSAEIFHYLVFSVMFSSTLNSGSAVLYVAKASCAVNCARKRANARRGRRSVLNVDGPCVVVTGFLRLPDSR